MGGGRYEDQSRVMRKEKGQFSLDLRTCHKSAESGGIYFCLAPVPSGLLRPTSSDFSFTSIVKRRVYLELSAETKDSFT